jgi:hypothetical protein
MRVADALAVSLSLVAAGVVPGPTSAAEHKVQPRIVGGNSGGNTGGGSKNDPKKDTCKLKVLGVCLIK